MLVDRTIPDTTERVFTSERMRIGEIKLVPIYDNDGTMIDHIRVHIENHGNLFRVEISRFDERIRTYGIVDDDRMDEVFYTRGIGQVSRTFRTKDNIIEIVIGIDR